MNDGTADQAAKFLDELAALVQDPAIRRLAERHARSHDLAEDALQDTFYAVARTWHPETINNLRAFFCTSLIRQIHHRSSLPEPVPAADIDAIAESHQDRSPPPSIASQAHVRLLAAGALTRLQRDRAELMATVPARSEDPHRYRHTILAAAETILRLLVEGPVTSADWNTVLRSQYPQWCDEPGLADNAVHLRLSRARRDVQMLLRAILPRQEDEPDYLPRGALTRTLQPPLYVIHPPDEQVRTADDAALTALFLKAEQTMLPGEEPYDLEQGLQIFNGWLDHQQARS